jgi:hypothetical protein
VVGEVVVAVVWLGDRLLGAVTARRLCLLDAALCLLSTLPLTEPCLAAAAAGERALLLGCSQVHTVRLLPLQERLELLAEAGDWAVAFPVALEGQATVPRGSGPTVRQPPYSVHPAVAYNQLESDLLPASLCTLAKTTAYPVLGSAWGIHVGAP